MKPKQNLENNRKKDQNLGKYAFLTKLHFFYFFFLINFRNVVENDKIQYPYNWISTRSHVKDIALAFLYAAF